MDGLNRNWEGRRAGFGDGFWEEETRPMPECLAHATGWVVIWNTNRSRWEFPGAPVVRIPSPQGWGLGLDPWSGNWNSTNQKKKKKQECSKENHGFGLGHIDFEVSLRLARKIRVQLTRKWPYFANCQRTKTWLSLLCASSVMYPVAPFRGSGLGCKNLLYYTVMNLRILSVSRWER